MTEPEPWIRPAEVALLYGVLPKTVTRWADRGLLPVHYTLGGHRRFLRSELPELEVLQTGATVVPLASEP